MQSNLAQKPQRPGLVAACLVGPRERQRPLGEGAGLLQVPSQEVAFALPYRRGPLLRAHGLLHHLLEQEQGLRYPPGQRISQTQVHSYRVQEEGVVRGMTVRQGTFEDDYGMREITPEKDQYAEMLLGSDRAVEMPGRLGNPCRFLAAGHPLGKCPEFCEGVD